MSLYGMLLAWRFFMGVGIGAEYPLSACITAEWASTRERGRMMCAVFLMQPMGQLLAWSVGLVALEVLSHHHDFSTDSPDAKVGIDKLWRWVIGMGAIPAALAILFRITIPESGRYTYDVKKDGPRALHDTIGVFQPASGRSSHHRLPDVGVEMERYPEQRPNIDGDAQSVAPNSVHRSIHPSVNGEWQQVDLDSANRDDNFMPQPILNDPADHPEAIAPSDVALNEADRASQRSAPFVPYADDLLVLVKERLMIRRAFEPRANPRNFQTDSQTTRQQISTSSKTAACRCPRTNSNSHSSASTSGKKATGATSPEPA